MRVLRVVPLDATTLPINPFLEPVLRIDKNVRSHVKQEEAKRALPSVPP